MIFFSMYIYNIYIYILYIYNIYIYILGMSSSQLTFIFFRGVGRPPTRCFFCSVYGMSSHIISNISSNIGCKLKNRLDHDSIAFLFIYRPGIS